MTLSATIGARARRSNSLGALAAALATLGVLAASAGPVAAQTVPPGPKITISAVTQVAPNLPQYTRVDQPMLRDGLAAKSGGRIEVNLSSWPERNVNGPEVLRLVRSGQVDIAAGPLTTVSGDVPMLDGVDLAGMNLDIRQARKVADAMLPVANREFEKLAFIAAIGPSSAPACSIVIRLELSARSVASRPMA